MGKIKSWILNHKLEFTLLLVILLFGAFMRLYKINEYMTFLGDEGRDVIIVRRLLTELHPPLIGPGTSIGNMYLGPAYYYMMAIPLLLANFNPVGPAVFIALLGVATIFFLWFVVREWFGNIGALVAAGLYAISPVIIIYSRSSWNPNIMPFFATLCVYSIWKIHTSTEARKGAGGWLIATAISFAFVLQSHYLGLLLLPVLAILWIMTVLRAKNTKYYIRYAIYAVVLFLLLMSPLAIFDFRHNFINSKAIIAFFTNRQTTVSVLPWKAIPQIPQILVPIMTDLVAAKNNIVGLIVTGIISIAVIFTYLIKREKYDSKKVSVILTILLWLGFAVIGLGLYKQHIYDHYFGFIFTVPFIILGGIAQYIFSKKNKFGFIIAGLVIITIIFVDLQNSPLNSPPNMQLQRAEIVAKKVEEIAGNNRFNFALIADNNYDSAYRYFLDLGSAKAVDINPQDTNTTVTDQLIVVCERVKEKCDPTHNAKTEIAAWGWSKIEKEYDNVFGVTIYRLAHTK